VSDIPEGVSIGIIGRSNIGQLLGGDESSEGSTDLVDKSQQQIVNDAVGDAQKILLGNNDCSKFFGGSQGALLVLSKLASLFQLGSIQDKKIGIEQSGQQTIFSDAQTGFTYRLFDKVIINTLGPFFNVFDTSSGTVKVLPGIGGYGPNTRQARVAMILHELAHLIKDPKTNDWLIPDDGRKPALSEENTRKIMKECGKEIEKI
jgi:hypothetical protein